ncbi:MAG: hypothetical protein NZM00_03290 [Anaerolinea sp.]|nr:hypothetical protein [Anaerolinea sp.]
MVDAIYDLVVDTPKYRIYWHDPERTICVIRAFGPRWSWEEAFAAVNAFDRVVRSVDHGVYVVYMFEARARVLPEGGNIVFNLRKLMSIHAPNTLFVIFIQPDPALRVFADIVSKAFQMTGRNYRYVNNVKQAMAMIEAHRGAQPLPETPLDPSEEKD